MNSKTPSSFRLRQLFEDLKRTPFPRTGRHRDALEDAYLSLVTDDADIAGLVESYLATGKLTRSVIELDPGIDEQLDELKRAGSDAELEKLLNYRRMLLSVAELLSQVSAVPIKHIRR